MDIKKSGMIAVVGRPNVGKSTLSNTLAGEKVAIVTNKPQTTRNRICAVCNRGETQFVIVDTPGFHLPRSKLGEYMVKVASESVSGVDAAVLMVEPIARVGTPEQKLIERLDALHVPTVLAVNKTDALERRETLLEVIGAYSQAFAFAAYVPISAKTGDGTDALLDELEKFVPEGHMLFPEGMSSDQPDRHLTAEIIREKALLCLDREVPHGLAIEIERFLERDNGIVEVGAVIYCEKESHKGIIIGKNGASLKKIGELARQELESFFGAKVFLETWVKVRPGWRDSAPGLRNFGFK